MCSARSIRCVLGDAPVPTIDTTGIGCTVVVGAGSALGRFSRQHIDWSGHHFVSRNVFVAVGMENYTALIRRELHWRNRQSPSAMARSAYC